MAATILVVEDNAVARKLFRVTLEAEGHAVMACGDGAGALAAAAGCRPDLALVDIVLPDCDGVDLLRGLRGLPGHADLPAVAITGLVSRVAELRVSAADFQAVLLKPVEPQRLVDAVREFLPADAAAPAVGAGRRLLLVDDDPVQRKLIQLRLERAGFAVRAAADGLEALAALEGERPDAVLCDVLMPRLDGFEFCRRCRTQPALADLPIVLMSAHYAEPEDRELARSAGADDLIVRTPSCEAALAALAAALAAPRPQLAVPAAEDFGTQHAARLVRQLERQAAFQASLSRRCAVDGVAVAVVRRLSAALDDEALLAKALEEVVHLLTDAAGAQRSALYLADANGDLGPAACAGRGQGLEPAETDLRRALGAADVLTADLPGPREAEGAAAGSLLLAPLIHGGERLGVLALAFEDRQLAATRLEMAGTAAALTAQSLALHRTLGALRRSRSQYQTLFEDASDAISLLTPDGMILEVNRRCLELFGYPAEHFVGRHIEEFAAPGHEQMNVAAYESSLNSGSGRAAPVALRRADGGNLYVEFSNRKMEVDGRELVLAIGRDVTATVEATRRLRDSEEKYRSLVENIPDVVWSRTRDRWLFVSANAAAVCGFTHDELTSDGFSWLRRVHPDDAPRVRAAVRNLYETGTPFDHEYRWQRQDGRWIWLHGRGRTGGEPGVIQGVVSDVTDRRLLEEQLRRAQKMEAVGKLTGGVAHDFNNILAAILAHSHFLLDELPAESGGREDAQQIQLAAERAAALTRQLLAFSRSQVLQPTVLDLNQVIGGLDKMLRRLLPEDIELGFTQGLGLGAVRADAGQLEQVIVNLAINARDAMPRGGRLSIETANVELDDGYAAAHLPVHPGRYVLLAVSDTGGGMDEETQRHVFEPFFTTKKAAGGTGLGLATCYGIVKQSGGFIWFYSEVGHGTVFKVYLPRVDAAPEATGAPAAQRAVLRGSATILLVEDDDAVRIAVERMLDQLGYRVLSAGGRAAALELARGGGSAIDLVLSDVIMPDANGPEVVQSVLDYWPRARALFMSGYTDHVALGGGMLDRDAQFIQKPFAPEALARKVREVLHGA